MRSLSFRQTPGRLVRCILVHIRFIRLTATLAAASLLCFLAIPAVAESSVASLKEASAADDRGDYATALRIFRPLADQGNGIAETFVGIYYYEGRGVPEDDGLAAEWFRKAADQGLAQAQDILGLLYYNGQGVPKDRRQARLWFQKAADQGYSRANDHLGQMYAEQRQLHPLRSTGSGSSTNKDNCTLGDYMFAPGAVGSFTAGMYLGSGCK